MQIANHVFKSSVTPRAVRCFTKRNEGPYCLRVLSYIFRCLFQIYVRIASTASLECLDNTMASIIFIREIAEVDRIIGIASLSGAGTFLNIMLFEYPPQIH